MLERSPDPGLEEVATAARARRDTPAGPRFLCAACREIIAFAQDRLAVEGKHEHRFTNPTGIVYEIVCFSMARGCAGTGSPTTEFTWFRPYAWQIGLCRFCSIHLGWRYSGGARSFYGLIRARLIEAK